MNQFVLTQKAKAKQFQIKSLKGLGIQEIPLGIIAAGAALSYLKETHHSHLAHLKPPIRLHENDFVWMDSFTITNLELIQPSDSKGKSLMEVLDDTKTAFGGRTLRKWMVLPLKDLSKINQRQKVVSHLIGNEDLSEFLQENLSEVGDVERLLARASAFKITPKQLVWFAQSLLVINQVGKRLRTENNPQVFSPYLPDDSSEAVKLILDTMDPDPPHSLLKGGVIKKGFHQELDQLKDLRDHAKDYLEKLKDKEIENSGIQSLKVGFNSVFGYFFEVRNLHKDKVPTHWIRKQTLVSAERYISEELKDFETKILGAEDKIYQIESKLFEDLLLTLPTFFGVIQQNALKIGELDVLCGFARLSKERNYSRPTLVDQKKLSIKMGRHPVIENYLPSNLKYIPNDAFFDLNHQIAVITGPNMSGKSAYLRQVALIVLMAQMGCYVPAKEVEMGVFGRIFTRVGASDNLSQGESTFMVEMTETARILNYLSEDSLVILDEIGRGTSTFDGISIARAIAEFLHDSPFKPFTLFATHYHELNELESEFERIQNFHVKVEQIDGKIHFLRSLEKGGSEHSFGINVAKMAGLPGLAIQRAEVILSQMESLKNSEENTATKMPKKEVLSTSNQNDSALQLSFFQLDDPVLEQIREQILEIDINALTPVEALVKLNQIKAVLSGGKKI
ncbi:MAG: DNA mismatch repair protein MutS [Flavobacteriaceae bacterium]|nr:MAG: DNA mismatch repair protein MutS [Flavobacteriaceae bacterium]